ncbi:Serine/threonine-protein kinase SRPK [Pseudocercospora fuligena]|uniref:Serine/threonine-protein kinase SRPK n=1 Tax=Pseudocercospora fuligena TaxID=685502 RepID=A0A8H6VK88_9PEZI|nr:Serine/threonine-protein kinase SRPK [Pseudocercospora fuligena]
MATSCLAAPSHIFRNLFRLPAPIRLKVFTSQAPRLIDHTIDEARLPFYKPEAYLPVHPGDKLDAKYEILTKIGYGSYSTVWLAKDITSKFWQPCRYVTLKIGVASDGHVDSNMSREREFNNRVAKSSTHAGRLHVRSPIAHFEISRSDGLKHPCVVYEPMKMTLLSLQSWFGGKMEPRVHVIVKVYLKAILQALDYLHTEVGVAHLDLKADNFLLSFAEDELPKVVDEYLANKLPEDPSFRHVLHGRTVYGAHDCFDGWRIRETLAEMTLQITDFGQSQVLDDGGVHYVPAQPHQFRSPEVIMGTPLSFNADIWNLGCLTWHLLEGEDLFGRIWEHDRKYDGRRHIGSMIALLGPPPSDLLEREKYYREDFYPRKSPGFEPWTYWGGPYFDKEGHFKWPELIPEKLDLTTMMASLEGEDKQMFLDMLRSMLQWDPNERASAKELLDHPWLRVEDD